MTERDLMLEITRIITQQEQMIGALDRLTTLVESLTKRVDVLEVKVLALEVEKTEGTGFDVH